MLTDCDETPITGQLPGTGLQARNSDGALEEREILTLDLTTRPGGRRERKPIVPASRGIQDGMSRTDEMRHWVKAGLEPEALEGERPGASVSETVDCWGALDSSERDEGCQRTTPIERAVSDVVDET
jgi:hypothetical protein